MAAPSAASAAEGWQVAADDAGKVSDAEFTVALREYQVAFIAQRSDERVEWAEKKKKEAISIFFQYALR